MKPSADRRQAMVAKIHIAKKDFLHEDDAVYLEMLFRVTKKTSCADLSEGELLAVLDDLKRQGWDGERKNHRAEAPRNLTGSERSPQMGKIEALLADGGKRWAYAQGCARKMYRKRLEFCSARELQGVIAALEKQKAREKKKAQEISPQMNTDKHGLEEA